MALIVSGISLPYRQQDAAALEQARRVLGRREAGVTELRLVKKSLDARRRDDIRFVYSVAAELEDAKREAALAARLAGGQRGGIKVTLSRREELPLPRGGEKLSGRPVVAGFGPAGMFAALLLARAGLRPVVLERGAEMDARVAQVEAFWSTGALHPQSNVQFGEGGAGAFSDGKLVTRIGDPRCAFVLDALAAHGAPEEIRWLAKPHIGTDRLRRVVKSLRREVVDCGGEVLFDTRLTGLRVRDGRLRAAGTTFGELAAPVLVLAPGHSARDLFQELAASGLPMEGKPFSVGVRIEHLQSEVDRMLYGELAGDPLLPRGEYQLSHRAGGRAVYTFCMCPGGVVVPAASEPGMTVTNGMSRHARDGVNANAALAVSVGPEDYGGGALDGVEFQRRLESAAFAAGGGGFAAPAQSVDRFLAERPGLRPGRVEPSYARGVVEGHLAELLPEFVGKMLREGLRRFEGRQRGFAAPDALLTGVETRTSSPVRILRGEDLQSPGLPGLYPCGEGAGYAGGIVSAAVDGVRVAQAILARYA